ncbi:MAG TPA: GAF domain-containing protein, partial [Chroococcidiopsis sp.]
MTSPDHNKPKILVVDDEPDNLDLLYRTFHREFKVLRAESGPLALDILSDAGDVAVIISDQRMPSMSGTEFLSLTATQYPDIIRIILTGYTDVGDLVEAINSGKVFKYVTKPWDDEELKAVVRQAVDTHNVLKARTQELRRTLRQETLLNAVTNTIRSALNYRQILQTIVETVGQTFEVDCGLLRPAQDGHLQDELFVFTGNAAADMAASPLNLTNLANTVWETRDVQVIPDVQNDERITADTPDGLRRRQAYEGSDIRSSLVVPLVLKEELVAVLVLHQCGQPRIWQDDEVQLVGMVADQAALALSQARAYEKVRSLARREALVNTITAAIRSSLDPQEIFAAITQKLGHALHTDGCALSLWTEDDEFVQCVGLHDAALEDESLSASVSSGGGTSANSVSANSLSVKNSSGNISGNIPANIDPSVIDPLAAESGVFHRYLPQSLVPIEGNPVLQQLLTTQVPVVIDDLSEHPAMNILDLPLRSPARSLLVVPLLYDGKIIGSISLRQMREPRHWEAEEVALAQAVAAQAAIAVQQSRLYQKTRQQAEQLLELDRQKTEFFQNVSHEFRTPLTLTIGPLESAVTNQQGLSYDQSVIALRNSRRLLRLVNQLLDLQRLDAKRMQPKFRPCNLVDFVTQVVDAFRPYCDKKQINLITDLFDCPPVYLDLEKFDKVLYNLLSNAMKFTPSSGRITVALQHAGDHCLLKVIDTGMGIRADQIPYLFDRFRQADGSANRSHEGSGLGLALVKELVELHGGKVTVDSHYGSGTTFSIWLQTGTRHLPPNQVIEIPAEIESSRAVVELVDIELDTTHTHDFVPDEDFDIPVELEPVVSPSNAQGNEGPIAKILVVDDNPDVRTYVAGVLQGAGYQVLFARNG